MRRLICICLSTWVSLPLPAAVRTAADSLTTLTAGVVQKDYSEQISFTVSGAAPFTYLLAGDDKPNGLLLDPQSGILHGTPTAAAQGTHRLKIIATDYNGKQTSKEFLLRISQPRLAEAASALAPDHPAATAPVADATPEAVHAASPKPAGTATVGASLPLAPPATVDPVAKPDTAAPAAPADETTGAKVDTAADSLEKPSIAAAMAGVKTLAVTGPKTIPASIKSADYAVYHADPGKSCVADASKQINTVAGTSVAAKAGTTSTLDLLETLPQGAQVCAAITYTDDQGKTATKESNVVTATSLDAEWGRVRAYFAGGILITNDSASFSSAHQFYALNLDKTWKLPGCYITAAQGEDRYTCAARGAVSNIDLAGTTIHLNGPAAIEGATITQTALKNATLTVTRKETIKAGGMTWTLEPGESFSVLAGSLTQGVITDGKLTGPTTITVQSGQLTTLTPLPEATSAMQRARQVLGTAGISTYFETRLTAIPVVSNSTNTTPNGNASNPAQASFVHANAAAADSPTPSFLTSQQTANVGVGMYLPILLARWQYNNTPNALFIAPIGKIGFNTLTGATSQTVVLPSNQGTGTSSFEQIYNFYDYGFRVGHMGLSGSNNVAPEIYSYLDISLGRFSNLEDLICHQSFQRGSQVNGSACSTAYGPQYTFDSRKRLYRIDIEGLLKIPNTIFYVGMNANIGQKQVMAEKIDPAFVAPDDLRFLFGTKFDIAQMFTRLGIKTQ